MLNLKVMHSNHFLETMPVTSWHCDHNSTQCNSFSWTIWCHVWLLHPIKENKSILTVTMLGVSSNNCIQRDHIFVRHSVKHLACFLYASTFDIARNYSSPWENNSLRNSVKYLECICYATMFCMSCNHPGKGDRIAPRQFSEYENISLWEIMSNTSHAFAMLPCFSYPAIMPIKETTSRRDALPNTWHGSGWYFEREQCWRAWLQGLGYWA